MKNATESTWSVMRVSFGNQQRHIPNIALLRMLTILSGGSNMVIFHMYGTEIHSQCPLGMSNGNHFSLMGVSDP